MTACASAANRCCGHGHRNAPGLAGLSQGQRQLVADDNYFKPTSLAETCHGS